MMFMLKKIVAPFLLPPGIIIALLVIVGGVLAMGRRWRIGLINLALGLSLWAVSTAPVANLLMQGLEAEFSIPDNPTGDVIILLSGGMIRQVPDISGQSAPAPSTLGRIVTAVRLYQLVQLPIIVSGGRVYDDADTAVAGVAKRFLVDLGVPADGIIVEDRARDTAQNARLTTVICRQRGFSKPILLTAAYHLKRASMAFDAAGLPVTPFPAYYLGSRNVVYSWRHLLPQAGALHTSASALHEYLGLLYYRLVGP
jgi:uncharacterized SAM-binding protein YcdF (DUF218 family)